MSVVPKNYTIIDDPQYGYKRVDPLPSEEELQQFYREEFYGRNETFNDSNLEVVESQQEFFRWRSEDIYDKTAELLRCERIRSVFDVGCGYGHALDYYREQGSLTAGVEPCRQAADLAAGKGHKVVAGDFEQFSTDGQSYDMVLMLNVLEHLPKPAEVLQAIRGQLLAGDGMLVVDVPNEFNAFQRAADEVHQLKQWWVIPPGHLNYFSGSSLNSLLQQCGYEVRYMESSFPMEIFLLMNDMYVGNSDVGSQCQQKRVAFERNLRNHGYRPQLREFYHSLAKLNLGRQVTVYASPKQESED